MHGNQLLIDSAQFEDAGQYRCTGTAKGEVATDDANLVIVPNQPQPPPRLPGRYLSFKNALNKIFY